MSRRLARSVGWIVVPSFLLWCGDGDVRGPEGAAPPPSTNPPPGNNDDGGITTPPPGSEDGGDDGWVGPLPDAGHEDAGDPPRPDAGTSDAGSNLPNLNPGWIGGACPTDSACAFANGFCFEANQGFPGGMCSEACTRVCPDLAGSLNTTTFCIASQVPSVPGGVCVSRCDFAKSRTGCRAGYHCESRQRFNEATTARDVCVPGDPPPPSSSCEADLALSGLTWVPMTLSDRSPTNQPSLTCHVETPGKLSTPVHGIDFRYISNSTGSPMTMACVLAKAVGRLAQHLASLDIVEVQHIGTYNCRVIAGTSTLSQHGLGLAIDLAGFKHRDGTVFNVERDFEAGNANPTSRAGKFLYDLSRWMYRDRVFNIILTPDFNAAHRNHFHVDLTAGAHYLKKPGAPPEDSYIGPNHGH